MFEYYQPETARLMWCGEHFTRPYISLDLLTRVAVTYQPLPDTSPKVYGCIVPLARPTYASKTPQGSGRSSINAFCACWSPTVLVDK